MPIKNRLAELQPVVAGWRQALHRRPELMFDTHETAAFVADRLREMGCDEVVTGVGRTGVVAVLRGRSTGSGRVVGLRAGPCFALRADMDALPIEETTGLAYASEIPGRMHACGHDGHTAMLLGAVAYLAETRAFDGTVVAIFQPAEEGGGGAKVMMDDGLLDRFGVQEVYAMHNAPGLDAGSFAIRPGAFYACTDQFDIRILGRAGHAAQPHQAIDAAVVASHVVLALQTIRSRLTDPVEPLVVSVTSLRTDSTAHNVIAAEALLKGTVRCFDRGIRAQVAELLPRIAEGTAVALGASAEVAYELGYPIMVNPERETSFAAEVARSVGGGCDDAPQIMWGEDFAYLLEERPGAYIWLGNGDSAGLHNAAYDFNDEIIPFGASWFAEIAERRMPL